MTDTGVPSYFETAYLAGGCFWGMQDLFRKQPGVVKTRVGYTGGHTSNPTYSDISRTQTGHAEAIEVVFDMRQTSYRDILAFFFQIHDPTTENRQGNDIGTQYRSAIFTLNTDQERAAQNVISELNAANILPGRIRTQVAPAREFYEAEEAHQDYLIKHPQGYSCHFVRPNWRLDKSDRG